MIFFAAIFKEIYFLSVLVNFFTFKPILFFINPKEITLTLIFLLFCSLLKILADKFKFIPNCKIKYEVEANSVFAYLTKEQHESAIKNGAKYYFWPHSNKLIGQKRSLHLSRFVCNWTTDQNDIENLITAINKKEKN